MKNLCFFVQFFSAAIFMYGQNVNLIVFCEEQKPFYVYVNGVKQNAVADVNVKMTDIPANTSLRIEFEDTTIPPIKQAMALEPGFEHTGRIKRDKNGQLKLRYFGRTDLTATPAAAATQTFHTAGGDAPVAAQPDPVASPSVNTAPANVAQPMVGITFNVSPPATPAPVTPSTSPVPAHNAYQQTSQQSDGDHRAHKGNASANSSPTGCGRPMSADKFAAVRSSVSSRPFSDSKMSTAQAATRNNCLSVDQVKEIAALFSMDADRLTYAKFAYDHCSNKGDYHRVGDVFSFSSSVDELNKFLQLK